MTKNPVAMGPQHALLGLFAVGAVSCAGILGIEDRGPYELTDGSVAQGGDAPDAGAGDAGSLGDDGPMNAPGADAAEMDALGRGDAPAPDGGGGVGPACASPCLMASGLDHPFLMTSDATRVYWTEFGDSVGSGNGYVKACPLSGCGAGPFLYATGLTNPRGLAVDSTHIYFGTASNGGGVVGGIWTCPLSGCGGNPTQLATAGTPFGVAVDSTSVYWVDNDDSTVHKIAKSPDAGTVDRTLYDAASGLIVYPGQCVVDGPFLFITDYSADAVRLSTSGGEPVLLGTSAISGEFGIATDPTNVYFGGSGVVMRSLKTLADSGAPISHALATPNGLAFEPATNMLYWSNWGSGNGNDGTVGKMATDGSAAHVLAASLATPEAVTVSGNYVFWISSGTLNEAGTGAEANTGALWQMAK